MGEYVDIDGRPTWVETRGRPPGEAEPLLLLHGGLTDSDLVLDAIGGPLAERFAVVAYDRRGHGRTADTEAPFHYADMADEVVSVLERVVGGPAHLVGWSDGGVVALHVALRRPDLVRRLVLVGVNFHVDGMRPLELDEGSALVARITAAYGEHSPDGPEHFETFFGKSVAMVTAEPMMTRADVARVSAPTLVLVGDDDIVDLGHTCALYESLPAGQLAVVPGASHLVLAEKPAEVARLVTEFLAAPVPPETLMPSRRGHGGSASTLAG